LKYIKSMPDIIGKFETFRNEKIIIKNFSKSGGESQAIVTRPTNNPDDNTPWRITTVQASLAACDSTAQMGAAYIFGFQLHKEGGVGPNATRRSARWCRITASAAPWFIP
jgi:hypothetical protein